MRQPGPSGLSWQGFGEGGGCWSLSCQIAALASLPTPQDVPRHRQGWGWSCRVRHEGSAFPDAKLLAHNNNNNNILRGMARADSRGWAGLLGLSTGSRP